MTKDTLHTPNLSSPAHSLYPFTMVAAQSIDSAAALNISFNSNAQCTDHRANQLITECNWKPNSFHISAEARVDYVSLKPFTVMALVFENIFAPTMEIQMSQSLGICSFIHNVSS